MSNNHLVSTGHLPVSHQLLELTSLKPEILTTADVTWAAVVVKITMTTFWESDVHVMTAANSKLKQELCVQYAWSHNPIQTD